jgi:septal ring factor EnvC (AmiA/AmiB activator)
MVFFIVLLAIPDRKQKQVEDEKTPATESPVTTEQNEVNRNINYKERKIQETKNKIAGLTSKVKDISENPGSLADMLVKLEAKWNELLTNEKKITDQKTDLETLLTLLEKELNYYRTEYLDILNHDEVKRSFITPEWSNRNDILTYYKIHSI